MSRNRKDFKTYYRYDGNGRIIPGSNILKKGYAPEEGKWQQADAYECCNPLETLYWVTDRYAELNGGELVENVVQSVIDSEGNTYRVSYYSPVESDGVMIKILKQDANGNELWEVAFYSTELFFIRDAGLMILETGNLAFAGIWEGEGSFGLDTFILSPEDGSVISAAPISRAPILPLGAPISAMYLRALTQGDGPETFRAQLAIEDVPGDQYTHVISFNLEDPFVTKFLTTSFVNNVFDEQYWYGAQGKILSYGADDVYYFAVSGGTPDGNYGSVMTYVRSTGASDPVIINSYYVDTSADTEDGEVLYASTYFDDESGNGWINAIHYDSKVTKWAENPGDGVNWRVGFNIDGLTEFDPIGIANDSLGNVFVALIIQNEIQRQQNIGFIKLSSDGVLDWAVRIALTIANFSYNELRNSVNISGEQLSIVSVGDALGFSNGSAFKLGTTVKPTAGTYGEYVVYDMNVSVEVQPNPTLVSVSPNSWSVGFNQNNPPNISPDVNTPIGFTVTNLQ